MNEKKIPTIEEVMEMTVDELQTWENRGYAVEIKAGKVTAIHYEGLEHVRN